MSKAGYAFLLLFHTSGLFLKPATAVLVMVTARKNAM